MASAQGGVTVAKESRSYEKAEKAHGASSAHCGDDFALGVVIASGNILYSGRENRWQWR